ncbi:Coiled-coil domain-containing protein 51 [Orchesella cincta]|uniref:Coiled-coil domain-containing protein 51 n=1 Tax=Orchesella cincta TaxID=48709 RepID=A0A1D2NDD1_ORCCI|nr:Coiled-coil domain-containing protein 51 [Orchesella cincta]
MSGPQRKALAELSKALEAAIARGRVQTQGSLNNLRSWINGIPGRTSVQAAINEQIEKLSKLPKEIPKFPTSEEVTERTKNKVGKLMTAYEEIIGMKEVRTAHARVLLAEAKFIQCQEQRRLASKDLLEVQNKLTEIRVDVDRTPRGDELYLDLIKKEFSVIKEERILRSRFEELEREEREVFSELSNALRFSHEKERAQNEKTKYWSIVGSIIGAGLGILGTTINNRMKQNHLKQILGDTATQVASIQTTVEMLTDKVNEGALTAAEVSHMVTTLKLQEKEIAKQREELAHSIEESVKMLKLLFTAMSVYHNDKFLKTVDELPVEKNSADSGFMAKLKGGKIHVSAGVCVLLAFLAYNYGY